MTRVLYENVVCLLYLIKVTCFEVLGNAWGDLLKNKLLGFCKSSYSKVLFNKICIFRSFSMKFFFSSKQGCMTNTIQSVFLSITHVFVSIHKLFDSSL